MSPKEIYYFLGKCLVLDEAVEFRKEFLEKTGHPEFSWEQFVQVGSSHLVLPALYVKLRNAGLLPHLPDELSRHLGEIHTLNVERNRSLMIQIRWLAQLLQKSGVHPVFLKGASALLGELYSDPGERILADIDCMVSESDFEKAVHLIKAEGYSSPPFLAEKLPMMHHYPSLFKANEPAQIEIHKFPVGKRQLKYLDLEDMRTRLFQTNNPDKSKVLRGQDQILINVIHSQLKDHGQYYASIPLRNVYEFYCLSQKHDLPEIGSLHPRVRLVFNNYMTVANKLFSPVKPIPVENRMRTKFFLIRLELNKSNRMYYRSSKFIRSVADLIYSYIYIFSKALYQKEYRIYLRIRLRNPAWYKHHVSVIRKRFS